MSNMCEKGNFMKIKGKILLLSISSILITGLIALTISLMQLSNALAVESEEGLKTTALASRNIYNVQGYGDYSLKEDGYVWRGMNFNVSTETSIVDDVKKEADVDITFFYGDTAVMTSLKDSKDNRLIDLKAGNEVAERVLKKGESYFDSHLIVNENEYQGYYVPIKQDSGEVIGILMASRSTDKMNTIIMKSAITTIGIIIGAILIFVGINILFTNAVTKALAGSKNMLQEVSGGNLTITLNNSILKRKDEIGDVARATDSLKGELLHIIGDIKDSSNTLMESSSQLDKSSEYTANVATQVEQAIDSISESALLQAEETKKASEDIEVMRDLIEKTSINVDELHKNSNEMNLLNETAANTLEELHGVNNTAKDAIEIIYVQTNTTNESAKKIQEAINLITSIAEETNLLSLNASIEAARAGEHGKGFSVVAYEIKKLAEQSNESARQIEEIISNLLSDSTQAVDTMNEVQKIISEQSDKVRKTEQIFKDIKNKIERSNRNVNVIERNTAELNEAKNSMVDIVNNLSGIAQNNAAGAQQTSAITQEVTRTVIEVANLAGKLKEIVVNLEKNIDMFNL